MEKKKRHARLAVCILQVLLPLVFIVAAALWYYPALGDAGNGEKAPITAAGHDLVAINSAPVPELAVLPGIGAAKAAAIAAWREENGPFTDKQQLLEVAGIGPATLEAIRDLIILE